MGTITKADLKTELIIITKNELEVEAVQTG